MQRPTEAAATVLGEDGRLADHPLAVVRENGWNLYHATPDQRFKVARRMMAQRPDHVVVVLRTWQPEECTKFFVDRALALGTFKQRVAAALGLGVPAFHVVFDGVSFPDANAIGALFDAQARDDGVLYGFVLRMDPQTLQLCD